jgi:hypothetical protein
MFKLPRLLCLIAILGLTSPPLRAETVPIQELMRQIDVLFADRKVTTDAISAKLPPMPQAHMAVIVDRVLIMFKDPEFRAAFAAKYPQGIESTKATEASFNFMLELLSSGLRLLPEEDQHEFVRFSREYMEFLTDDECKQIIAAPQLSAQLAMETELRFSATLTLDRFIRIQGMYREAALAVLHRKPGTVVLSPEELQAATAKLGELSEQGAKKLSPEVLAKFTSLQSAPADALCNLTIDLFDSILALEPAERRKVVRGFLETMAKPQ